MACSRGDEERRELKLNPQGFRALTLSRGHVPKCPRRAVRRDVVGLTFNHALCPIRASHFFRRNVVLSFQEDAIGIRLRDVIGPDNMMWDNMMWGSDYPHSESTFPQSRKILAEILAGVPEDEQAKIAGCNAAPCTNLTWRGCPSLLEEPTSADRRTGRARRSLPTNPYTTALAQGPHRLARGLWHYENCRAATSANSRITMVFDLAGQP